MAIKRYFASKDNTITNAYKANLTTRGVSGNMGQSDILEMFHIYAQASSSSMENCKILLKFNLDEITADRTAGNLPASGNVNFVLSLYDAPHSQTTPKDFTVVTTAISQSWEEGLGLDMENYSNIGASNWIYASDTDSAATAAITLISSAGEGDLDTKTFSLTGSAGDTQLFTFNGDNTTNTNGNIGIDGEDVEAMAKSIVDSINDDTVTIGITASPDPPVAVDGDYPITLTQDTAGTDGNKTIDGTSITDVITYAAAFTGGAANTSWTTEGGDYITGSDAAPLEYTFTQTFDTGFENLEIDVSHLVEDWISEEIEHHGFGVHLTGSLDSATDSYYTKMFFARGSQFFFKRPVLEARWDSSKKDNRGNFNLSSSLVPASDNLMKLYLYNVVRGQLTNIPAVGEDDLLVSIYSGSSPYSAAPTGAKIGLALGGGTVASGDINTTASFVETGIYSCSFAYTSSAITTIYDIWHSGGIEYHTGSAITVNTHDSQNYNIDQKYVSKIINLKAAYSRDETARFRVYTRQKNWSPTIYTKATTAIQTSIVDDVYYQVKRVNDNLAVIPYGTGSSKQTLVSYDVSGSYFDLDINLLDSDTVYETSFVYVINGSYVEQPEKFRFRVE